MHKPALAAHQTGREPWKPERSLKKQCASYECPNTAISSETNDQHQIHHAMLSIAGFTQPNQVAHPGRNVAARGDACKYPELPVRAYGAFVSTSFKELLM